MEVPAGQHHAHVLHDLMSMQCPCALLKRLLVSVSADEQNTELFAGSRNVLVQLSKLRRERAARRAPVRADVNADHVERSQVFKRLSSAAGMSGLERRNLAESNTE